MHSHLDIQINGQSLVLPDDFSLSVSEQNPMFNDVSFFSYPANIPTKGNMAVLKNIAHRDSNMRAMDLEHADARIFADGLPLNHGQVITQDGSEIKDTFEFNIDAQQQSFSELIGNLDCRDVRVKDRLLIGKQIGRINGSYSITARDYVQCYRKDDGVLLAEGVVGESQVRPYMRGNIESRQEFTDTGSILIEAPQALGFSVPMNINVSQTYPFPYCNARVSYEHPDIESENNASSVTGSSSSTGSRRSIVKGNNSNPADPHDFGKYWVLDADRQQSGVCFYVLYFLDCLFAHLGVAFDKDKLMEVEDMKRLCFFTTKCSYDLEETDEHLITIDQINQWLTDHNCGGQMTLIAKAKDREIKPNESDGQFYLSENYETEDYMVSTSSGGVTHNFYVTNYYHRQLYGSYAVNAYVNEMYANSGNFPNASVSSVISSLENSFGIRFLYDPEKRLVTACLLRDIYKRRGVLDFKGKVLSMTPINEKITGIRMIYSTESESKEQRNNVRNGIKDYNTEFDYIEYPEDRTILDLSYGEIAKRVSATNMNVYVDLTTGNSYRVKIDSAAEDSLSLRPVLFQVAQFKGIDVGDCSERHKDYVKEFTSDFAPLALNVINAQDYTNDTSGDVSPVLAPLLDVDMEHEYLEKKIQQVISQKPEIQYLYHGGPSRPKKPWPDGIELMLLQSLSIAESYDPTQTDSGNSPLQDIDWGLTVGIMRGAGSDSELIEYDRGYDGFDNSRWKDTIAIYELTSDTMDLKGAIFDYNGTDEGDGGGERFSLQIRSWAQFVYYIDDNDKLHINKDVSLAGQAVEGVSDKTWLIPCDDDERDQQGHVINKIRSRGLFDTFMREHAKFLLGRKKYKVRVLAAIAQLLDIRNHWTDFYVLDGKIGLIDKVNYEIQKSQGVREAELEFYSY